MLEYTNRKGDTYYFKSLTSKTGKTRYFTTKQVKDATVAQLPDGYEIYEGPQEAVVTLRVKKRKDFSEDELAIIAMAVKMGAGIKYFIVDVVEDTLTVYISKHNDDFWGEMVATFGSSIPNIDHGQRANKSSYNPQMRFIKRDNSYYVERMYYSGSGGWMSLDRDASLEVLAQKYCYHLEKESFFELGR
jgi:hypothetical protein